MVVQDWNYYSINCVFLQETILREQVEGLVEEEENEEETAAPKGEEEDVAVGAITLAAKKTERQRKRERAIKIKVQHALHTQLTLKTFTN